MKPDLCCAAADHGYPSVMIDASSKPLGANIAIVKDVAEYAHKREVNRVPYLDHVGQRSRLEYWEVTALGQP